MGEARPTIALEEGTDPAALRPAVVVVNPSSGSAGDLDAGDLRVRELRDGEDLERVMGELADEGAAVLGMAGGDGSVGCAAGVAVERDRVLLALPGGTLNHFSRELGVETVEAGRRALDAGRVARVDVAEVSGRVFVNNASVGVYGEIVDRRERLEGRMPKRLALLIACLRVLRAAPKLSITVDGRPERVYLLFVGNDVYEGLGMGGRRSLQEGLLDVRVLPARSHAALLAALWRVATGSARRGGWLRRWTCTEVTVEVPAGTKLAHDGEVREAAGPLVFRSRPGALRVVVGGDA
ncbi:MAG: diacylglycerol kinase family protein [Thermoleophilia bacterium]